MKKLLLPVVMLLIFFVLAGLVQQRRDKDIPAAVKATVQKEFPAATALRWEKEKKNYEASFLLNKVPHSVLIDAGGSILKTEVSIAEEALPAGVMDYVKRNYPGKRPTELARITDGQQQIKYEVEIGHKDLLFDGNGKFLQIAKD